MIRRYEEKYVFIAINNNSVILFFDIKTEIFLLSRVFLNLSILFYLLIFNILFQLSNLGTEIIN